MHHLFIENISQEIKKKKKHFQYSCSRFFTSLNSDPLSLIYLTTESVSLVVEQWARYPEVAGSIPRRLKFSRTLKLVGNDFNSI